MTGASAGLPVPVHWTLSTRSEVVGGHTVWQKKESMIGFPPLAPVATILSGLTAWNECAPPAANQVGDVAFERRQLA